MERQIQLSGDGLAVGLVAISDGKVTLEVCLTKDGEPIMFWTVEHLGQGDAWRLSNCDIKVPCELTR